MYVLLCFPVIFGFNEYKYSDRAFLEQAFLQVLLNTNSILFSTVYVFH